MSALSFKSALFNIVWSQGYLGTLLCKTMIILRLQHSKDICFFSRYLLYALERLDLACVTKTRLYCCTGAEEGEPMNKCM